MLFRKNKNIKYIACTNCSKYCQNQNQNKLKELLQRLDQEGFEEIIFCCESLNGSIVNLGEKFSTRIGYRDNKKKIKYF